MPILGRMRDNKEYKLLIFNDFMLFSGNILHGVNII